MSDSTNDLRAAQISAGSFRSTLFTGSGVIAAGVTGRRWVVLGFSASIGSSGGVAFTSATVAISPLFASETVSANVDLLPTFNRYETAAGGDLSVLVGGSVSGIVYYYQV